MPPSPDPSPAWGRRVLAGVLLGAVAYLALVLVADAPALGRALAGLDAGHALVAVGFVLAGLAVRSVRWSLYRERLGVRAAFPTNLLLGVPQGRTGLVVKAQHLRERGVRYGQGIPAVVAERTVEILAIGLVLAALLPFGPRVFVAPALAGTALTIVYLALLRHPRLVEPVLARLERWHVMERRAHDLRLALAQLPPMLRGRLLATSLAWSVVGLLLEAGAAWSLAAGLGLPLAPGEAVLAFFLGSMAGLVSMLPGGILAAEGGMIGALVVLGVPLPEAAALTLATRACTLWLTLGLGVGAALAVPRKAESPLPPRPGP